MNGQASLNPSQSTLPPHPVPFAPGEGPLALEQGSHLQSVDIESAEPPTAQNTPSKLATMRKLIAPNPCSLQHLRNIPVGIAAQLTRATVFTALGSLWVNGTDPGAAAELVAQAVTGAAVLGPFIATGVELGLGRSEAGLLQSAIDLRYGFPIADMAFMMVGAELLARAGLSAPTDFSYENESMQDPSDFTVGFTDDGMLEVALEHRNAGMFDELREATIPIRGAAIFGMTLAALGFMYMCYDSQKTPTDPVTSDRSGGNQSDANPDISDHDIPDIVDNLGIVENVGDVENAVAQEFAESRGGVVYEV